MSDASSLTASENGADLALQEMPEPTVALNPLTGFRTEDFMKSIEDLVKKCMARPDVFSQRFAIHMRKVFEINTGMSNYEVAVGDRRFGDIAWTKSEAYRKLLQHYLAVIESLEELVEDLQLDAPDRLRADYVLRLISDSFSPTNTVLGNPEVVRKSLETQGQSLLAGLNNFLQDQVKNYGMPAQVRSDSFEVGKNIATTQGAVVFRNDVLEVIQYSPTTAEVSKRPLIMTLAMINKYYALDLTPDRSLIKYCVDNGKQVFVVSWANPGPEQASWGISTYANAVREAITATKEITGSEDVNVMALCSGGMVMTALAAYLSAIGDSSIHSMTIGVCMLEMQQTDMEMTAFVTEDSLQAAKQRSKEAGVLRGHELAKSMLWLRPKDLIWGNVVNNYLLGNPPPAFDLLYWNNDWTNLPAQLHADVIDLFSTGSLLRSGETDLEGVALDIGSIDCDKFFLGATTDHITPWKTCYRSAYQYGGDKEFVLSESGHIQTFLNGPKKASARFHRNSEMPESADEWWAGAEVCSESWWPYWMRWLTDRSGPTKPAPDQLGSEQYPAAEVAPGTYVYQKSDDQ